MIDTALVPAVLGFTRDSVVRMYRSFSRSRTPRRSMAAALLRATGFIWETRTILRITEGIRANAAAITYEDVIVSSVRKRIRK